MDARVWYLRGPAGRISLRLLVWKATTLAVRRLVFCPKKGCIDGTLEKLYSVRGTDVAGFMDVGECESWVKVLRAPNNRHSCLVTAGLATDAIITLLMAVVQLFSTASS